VYIDRTPKIDFQAQKSCHRQTPRLKEPALRVKQEGEFMPLCFDGGGKWQHVLNSINAERGYQMPLTDNISPLPKTAVKLFGRQNADILSQTVHGKKNV
jgi:hypothetical protein